MRAPWLRPFLLFGLGITLATVAMSAPEQSQAVFEHLTTADGLPQSTVYTTLQDSQGFVWLGTEDGLVRYDGHRLFRYGYRPGAAEGLPGNFIQALAEDAHHDLWIAVPDGGLARWQRDTDRFTVFRHGPGPSDSLASDIVVALLIDADGRVWVGTSDAGIDVLDPRTGRIEHLRHDAMRAESLIDDRIKTLARSPSGDIWVGTQGGLDRWVPDARAFVHCPPVIVRAVGTEPQGVLALYADAGGTLWEGLAGGGLVQRDANGGILAQFRHEPGDHSSLSNDNVRAVLEDSDGRLWVGTEDGLDVLDRVAHQFTHYRHQDEDPGSLTDSYVMSLYQDANHLLWVGTRVGGVNRWNPRSWDFGSHRPAWLAGRMVTAFADAGDDRVWVASLGGGLVRFDPSTGQHEDIERITGRP
jgi:ligand-binding sensor domain-containing protein